MCCIDIYIYVGMGPIQLQDILPLSQIEETGLQCIMTSYVGKAYVYNIMHFR